MHTIEILRFVEFFSLGTAAGILGTIIGAGGGFFVVPYLLLVTKMNPQLIIGTSMTMVFFNALSGSFAYFRQKRIDFYTGVKFSLAAFPGSILGAYITKFFNGSIYRFIFGLFLLFVGILILVRKKYSPETSASPLPTGNIKPGIVVRKILDASNKVYVYSFNEILGLAFSFIIGFVAASLGIGGGILLVPLMIYLLGFPVQIATATAFFVLLLSTFFSTVIYFFLNHVHVISAVYLSSGAIFGAQIGALLSKKISSDLIQKLLAICLILVSLKLIF